MVKKLVAFNKLVMKQYLLLVHPSPLSTRREEDVEKEVRKSLRRRSRWIFSAVTSFLLVRYLYAKSFVWQTLQCRDVITDRSSRMIIIILTTKGRRWQKYQKFGLIGNNKFYERNFSKFNKVWNVLGFHLRFESPIDCHYKMISFSSTVWWKMDVLSNNFESMTNSHFVSVALMFLFIHVKSVFEGCQPALVQPS